MSTTYPSEWKAALDETNQAMERMIETTRQMNATIRRMAERTRYVAQQLDNANEALSRSLGMYKVDKESRKYGLH
jgi:hypothetical protein